MNIKNKKIATILGLSIVFVFGVLAILPFLGVGFLPTHDGEFHFIRFMEFFRMLSQGYVIPRWAPTINSGYGLPVFEFLYPFANYISALLHVIGMEFVTSFKISSALGYITASLFSFLWLKKRFGVFPAVIGTIVSAYVPYWFVELYVRGAIGEVWAIAFLFMALWSIEAKKPLLFATAMTGIVLSHNILTIIVGPFILVYLLWRRDWKWVLYMLLGIGLASWFWLPAIFESKYMVGLNTVSFKDHFASIVELFIPSWGTNFSGVGYSANKMSFQIGIGPIMWMMLACILLVIRRIKGRERTELLGLFGIVVLALCMTLPQSIRIWEIVPVIQYIQHPWRYLVYLIPVTAYIGAVVGLTIKKKWFVVLLTLVSMGLSFGYTRGAVYEPRNDAYYASRTNFTDSTSSMGNSLSTIWTPWKETKSLTTATDVVGNPIIVDGPNEKYLDRQYTVSLDSDTVIRFHILYFPGWTAYVDGELTSIDYQSQGTIDVGVPKGTHTVRLVMQETVIRMLADVISVGSLVIFGYLGILWYRRRHQ